MKLEDKSVEIIQPIVFKVFIEALSVPLPG